MGGAVFPADGDKADTDGVEVAVAVEAVGDAGDGVGFGGEEDALEEAGVLDLGGEGFAEGEDDVAVLVGVLEDGVALVVVEAPAGGGDDFVVAVEGFVGGDEVQNRLRVEG